ncbi:MAG: hypothetical protein OXG37_09850, partial [Actinomycetia bacterium]|nr:hypothetical protein [Actinomycetes bacterium]
MTFVVGIDVGCTHTDCIASDGQTIRVAKAPTSPDPTDGLVQALELVADAYGFKLRQLLAACARFVYGSTTATNMFVAVGCRRSDISARRATATPSAPTVQYGLSLGVCGGLWGGGVGCW